MTYLYIFGHSDCGFSSEQKVKLFYAARASRGHRFYGVSTNSVRYGFYPTCFILDLSIL